MFNNTSYFDRCANAEYHETILHQCDQMARLLLQYLAIYDNKNLPNSKHISQIRFKLLSINEWTTKRWNFAELLKFCHIWSHCFRPIGML